MLRSLTRTGTALLWLTLAATAAAQDGYRQPPAPIAQILDAERTPIVSVGPDRVTLLLQERDEMPSIAELAAPEARLAGLRINPRTNAASRATTYKGIRLLRIGARGAEPERRIVLPAGASIGNITWAPDSRHIAFTMVGDSGLTLWLADVGSATARQLSPAKVNAAMGAPCTWIDAARLVCRLVPANRRPPPAGLAVPSGPVIQQSMARAAANRTYQDLLQNAADEAQFEYLATSHIAIVSTDGSMSPIGGSPGVYGNVDPSPDGRYLLVNAIQRPFSYIVPVGSFPSRIAVWDMSGFVVKSLAQRPLRDDVGTSFDAVPRGMRVGGWRPDAPATLWWVEALDEGDPATSAEKRDRLYTLSSPFTGEPSILLDVELRSRGVQWVRENLAFVSEGWSKTRRTRTWAVDPGNPSTPPRLLFDYSSEDRYANPGSFVTAVGPFGERVVLTSADGRFAYLQGSGASPEGDRPFLDRIELSTGKTQRLWRSEAPYYEQIVAVLDNAAARVVTQRESLKDPPNYFLRDIRAKRVTQLTRFADPAPQFASVEPRLITYKRDDGVQLSAKLYLPPGYTPAQGPLPFLFWAYPEEFRSAAAAAQVVGSPYRFVRPAGTSHLFLLTQGYGILDGPTMPIVGEGDREPNDTYIQQLVSSAKAAVDEVVRLGVADRSRIAVGGHSYGAFMTANLLAHSDLFRAGIARSGAYNRTLTPFGFQAEERTFWQARDTYGAMSPFYFADKINEPILLIHGGADNNSGTFPVQSERMYAALMGNRGTVRYVVLPAEAHGYAARESVGHTLWEMVNWLDTYVKNAPRAAASGAGRD